jgi:hypothetical protein
MAKRISMLSAVTRWQHGTTNDNEFVGEMADCMCSTICSGDAAKTFSHFNVNDAEVIFEVHQNVTLEEVGTIKVLQGYFGTVGEE